MKTQPSLKPVDIRADSRVGDVLKAVDEALEPHADALGVHWKFYMEPYTRAAGDPDPIVERYAELWPATVMVAVRGGDNEGWIIEIWPRPTDVATRPIGMSKVISHRSDAFEYARLVSIAVDMY